MESKLHIPFFGIDRMYYEHSVEILNCVSSVFKSGKVLMGPEVDELEERFATRCHRKYAISVGSCTDALFFSLKVAGIKPGDHVLVTSFSFIASVSSILRIGAIPVFVDVDSETYMMNLDDLESKINNLTKAIIAVHLFGDSLNIYRLEEIARKNNLILIEDAAQSLGSKHSNRVTGSMGDLSCISFDPTKIIGAFGNGGIILTDDKHFYSELNKLRFHGRNPANNEFEILGYNSRLATSQAAILIYELDQLDTWIRKKNIIASYYINELSNIKAIQLPKMNEVVAHSYHKFVISIQNRDNLKDYLAEKGIQTMIHYKKALFENPLFNNYHFYADNIIHVHKVKDSVLSLPIYPELKSEETEYICKTIKEYFQSC